VSAPVRPSRGDEGAAQGRTSSDGGGRRPSSDAGDRGSSRAVPRGSDVSGSPSSGSRTANASNGDSDSPSRRAVPTYSRPRDGRPITGTAVDRPAGYYGGGSGNGSPIYYPIYPSYRYYYPSYGFGLGFYDFGWYDPYYYGSYYPGGYGGGYYGGGYQGGGYGTGTSSYGRAPTGSLRLKIKPREGQVYVDGYFVGVIDEFDGVFQKLGIDAGGHRVEIKAPGHEPISFDVLITPGETVTYKGELRRIQ
jgi:PEGA domain